MITVSTADWTALGPTVRLVVTEPAALDRGRELLSAELAAVDRACSRFRPDSELRLLDHADGRPTAISPLLTEAIVVALRAARLTDGAVDPTVGAALEAIGYDRDFAALPRSGPAVTIRPAPVPGWRLVDLDARRQVVTVPAGVRLDLGATGKAFAADRAAGRLAAALECGVLVSLGGDIAVAGRPPAGGWLIGTEDQPDGAVISINGGGVATSSTEARRWTRGDRVFHHLLDPVTGLPVESPWRMVTVHARSCVDANTASTASIIRGRPAVSWLAGLGLPARLVAVDGTILTVGGWPEAVR